MKNYLPSKSTQIKFVKFTLFGGVVFTWGILLNFLMVDVLQFDKKIAYLFVISSQILVCFLLNRYVIFVNGEHNFFQTFSGYLAALAIFRMADWTLYVIQINWLDMPYLLAQTLSNIFIFFTKFPVYRIIFESKPAFTAVKKK